LAARPAAVEVISVVLPVADDKTGWLPRILERLSSVDGIEIIAADSSSDGSTEKLKSAGAKIVPVDTDSRAVRLQKGIEAATHETVLLHHPRSIVEPEGLRWLVENAGSVSWGGFTHAFDAEHYLLRFTSWYSNKVGGARKGILYLDHCIFFKKGLLTRPIPPVVIFEDTELSKILKESGRPEILPYVSTTSAVRFTKNGVWRQALMNQKLKWEYWAGRSDRRMNARYERGLDLNA